MSPKPVKTIFSPISGPNCNFSAPQFSISEMEGNLDEDLSPIIEDIEDFDERLTRVEPMTRKCPIEKQFTVSKQPISENQDKIRRQTSIEKQETIKHESSLQKNSRSEKLTKIQNAVSIQKEKIVEKQTSSSEKSTKSVKKSLDSIEKNSLEIEKPEDILSDGASSEEINCFRIRVSNLHKNIGSDIWQNLLVFCKLYRI